MYTFSGIVAIAMAFVVVLGCLGLFSSFVGVQIEFCETPPMKRKDTITTWLFVLSTLVFYISLANEVYPVCVPCGIVAFMTLLFLMWRWKKAKVSKYLRRLMLTLFLTITFAFITMNSASRYIAEYRWEHADEYVIVSSLNIIENEDDFVVSAVDGSIQPSGTVSVEKHYVYLNDGKKHCVEKVKNNLKTIYHSDIKVGDTIRIYKNKIVERPN